MLNGADSAANQTTANSFITTSGILPASDYPQLDSWASMKYDRPGGPFDPHTGSSAAVTTEDTIYLGFGFEGITGAPNRAAVMDRAMDYLLDD